MKRKLFLLLFALAAMVAGVWMLQSHLSLQQLLTYEDQIRAFAERHPFWAVPASILAYYVLSLIPGLSGKSVIVGWLLGFWSALLVVVVGLTAAAVTTFAFSRYLLREFVETKVGEKWLQRMRGGEGSDHAISLLTLRLVHAPYSLTNYAAGAAGACPVTFAWTTALGLIPGAAAFVYAGTQLPSLRTLVENPTGVTIPPSLIAALVLVAAVPWGLKYLARRFGNRLSPALGLADADLQ